MFGGQALDSRATERSSGITGSVGRAQGAAFVCGVEARGCGEMGGCERTSRSNGTARLACIYLFNVDLFV